MADIVESEVSTQSFRPLSRDRAPPQDYQLSHAADLGVNINPLMDISHRLFSLIRRIRYVTRSSPAFPHASGAAFHVLGQEILNWKYDSQLTSLNIDLPIALDLTALAESYRLAAIILLYRRADLQNLLLLSLASHSLGFIRRMPRGSAAEASLAYPLFLTGAELDSEAEIEEYLLRLRTTREISKFENIKNVEKVLEEVWKPRLNGWERKNWEEMPKEWGWSISSS